MNAELELDPIVDAFDQQWQTGSRPQLTFYLERVSDSQRNELAKMLVPIDVEYRQQAGEAVDSTSDYGHLGQEIVELADSVVRGDASAIDQRHTKTSAEGYEISVQETATYQAGDKRPAPQIVSNGGKNLQQSGQFGDYQVLNKIAEHGQGIVYRANHPRLHRQVVIKVCKKGRSAPSRQALLDEAKVLAQLNHPNVATVYDVQIGHEGNPYLVMEYIEGRNLDDVMRESRPSVTESVAMIKAVCDGLQHAHSFGILHLDLKPANIVIRGSDRVPKIIDFGLARLKPAYGAAESSSYGGTFRYMAPEQAMQLQQLKAFKDPTGELDARADLYAVGAILYEMLTGKQLRLSFKDDDKEIAQAIANDYDKECLNRPDIPKQLANLCERALATNPEDRLGTVAEFASQLSLESAIPKATSRRGLLVGAGILVCIAALLGSAYSLGILPRGDKPADFRPDKGLSAAPENEPIVPADLSIELFSEQDKGEAVREGFLGSEFTSAKHGQVVRVHATLPKPCYCYLIALNPTKDPEWNIQLCFPKDADTVPELTSNLSFPLEQTGYFPLTDGNGQQAFVLITCPEPLKPFSEWKSAIGERLKWPVNDTMGVWKFQKSEIKPLYAGKSLDRGPTKYIAPDQFTALLENLTKALSSTDEEITAIAFPVLP